MKSYILRDTPPSTARESLNVYPELLQELLFHRGIEKVEDAEAFLNPNYDLHIHDPYLMKDMERAVDRVLLAIKNNEHVVIYTDYDADGIPAAVVIYDFFKKIGFTNFENYFPHRYEEGYGLNIKAVESFKETNTKLIITADCGTSDVEPVKRANELGMDVIITDHHLSQTTIPAAYAILNPKQPECGYPYNMLCGSGVIFKLIQGILKKNSFGMKEGMEKWFLDMVGLATMADMVPLKGENRVFAYYGLTVLRKSPRLGLSKLLQKVKVNQRTLSEDDIGFMIVPRINAASRMGLPIEAFYLLTASDETRADQLSTYLNKINDERKGVAAAITKEVKKIIGERVASGELKKVIVIGNPNWKPPLLGPVTNSLMETYHVPVFMWGRVDGDVIKGSCRSDGTISVLELMQGLPEGLLAGFGGHRASGGFSIMPDKIHFLEEELLKAYEKISLGVPKVKTVYVDKKLSLDDVHWKTYNVIEKLAPFGEGNQKPLFLFENVEVEAAEPFGKEKNHFKIMLRKSNGSLISAIGFFMGADQFSNKPEKGKKINLIANMEKSMFRNYPELRLRIVDIY